MVLVMGALLEQVPCRKKRAASRLRLDAVTGLRQRVRLSPDPAREPPDERTEYQTGLDRKGNVGGHADEHSER